MLEKADRVFFRKGAPVIEDGHKRTRISKADVLCVLASSYLVMHISIHLQEVLLSGCLSIVTHF